METTIKTAPTDVASFNTFEIDSAVSNAVNVPSFMSNILGLDNRQEVPTDLFQPKRLSDLRSSTFQKDLIDFIKRHPEIDFVYKFDLPKCEPYDKDNYCISGLDCFSNLPLDTGKGIFVGGSTALRYLQGFIKGDSNVNWKSSDTDLFFLNCVKNTRMEGAPGSLDFIFCKDKSIEEVLLNFDLPCCRVGFDFKYNFYASAQALVSIFTGKMYLPEYFSSENDFLEKLGQFPLYKKDGIPKHYITDTIKRMIVKRFYERVKKYQSRGFKTVYTHVDYLLPWVKNRFTYIDFDLSK